MINVNGTDYDAETFTPAIKAAIVQLNSCREDRKVLAIKLGVMAAAERCLIAEISAAVADLPILPSVHQVPDIGEGSS
jgi:hypothetical protein